MKQLKQQTLKVEITRDWVKFFRRDDMLTCYTYRPLHLLKCDTNFIRETKIILEESCQYNEEEFNDWLKNDCDMPPFPISAIFTSDYTDYTCKAYVDAQVGNIETILQTLNSGTGV